MIKIRNPGKDKNGASKLFLKDLLSKQFPPAAVS
jgi:hypothetical protein